MSNPKAKPEPETPIQAIKRLERQLSDEQLKTVSLMIWSIYSINSMERSSEKALSQTIETRRRQKKSP